MFKNSDIQEWQIKYKLQKGMKKSPDKKKEKKQINTGTQALKDIYNKDNGKFCKTSDLIHDMEHNDSETIDLIKTLKMQKSAKNKNKGKQTLKKNMQINTPTFKQMNQKSLPLTPSDHTHNQQNFSEYAKNQSLKPQRNSFQVNSTRNISVRSKNVGINLSKDLNGQNHTSQDTIYGSMQKSINQSQNQSKQSRIQSLKDLDARIQYFNRQEDIREQGYLSMSQKIANNEIKIQQQEGNHPSSNLFQSSTSLKQFESMNNSHNNFPFSNSHNSNIQASIMQQNLDSFSQIDNYEQQQEKRKPLSQFNKAMSFNQNEFSSTNNERSKTENTSRQEYQYKQKQDSFSHIPQVQSQQNSQQSSNKLHKTHTNFSVRTKKTSFMIDDQKQANSYQQNKSYRGNFNSKKRQELFDIQQATSQELDKNSQMISSVLKSPKLRQTTTASNTTNNLSSNGHILRTEKKINKKESEFQEIYKSLQKSSNTINNNNTSFGSPLKKPPSFHDLDSVSSPSKYPQFTSEQLIDIVDLYPSGSIAETVKDITSNNLFDKHQNKAGGLHKRMQQIHHDIQNMLKNGHFQKCQSTQVSQNSSRNPSPKLTKTILPTSTQTINSNRNEDMTPWMNTLLKSLKKDHPNFFQNTPSGRAEVGALKNWVQKILNNVLQSKDNSEQEMIQKADDALVLAFNEIVRQVSYHCVERGELLMQIFSSYFGLNQKMQQFEILERQKLVETHNKDQQISFDFFTSQQKLKDDIIAQLQIELQKSYKENKKIASELEDNEKQVKKLGENNFKLLDMNKNLRKTTIEFYKQNQLVKKRFRQKIATIKKNYTQGLRRASQLLLDKNGIQIQNELEHKIKLSEDEEDEDSDISLTDILKKQQEKEEAKTQNVYTVQKQELDPEFKRDQMEQTDPYMCMNYCDNAKCQTDLQLIDSKYDKILDIKFIDRLVMEQEVKDQLNQNYMKMEEDLESMSNLDDSRIQQESSNQQSRMLSKKNSILGAQQVSQQVNSLNMQNVNGTGTATPNSLQNTFRSLGNDTERISLQQIMKGLPHLKKQGEDDQMTTLNQFFENVFILKEVLGFQKDLETEEKQQKKSQGNNKKMKNNLNQQAQTIKKKKDQQSSSNNPSSFRSQNSINIKEKEKDENEFQQVVKHALNKIDIDEKLANIEEIVEQEQFQSPVNKRNQKIKEQLRAEQEAKKEQLMMSVEDQQKKLQAFEAQTRTPIIRAQGRQSTFQSIGRQQEDMEPFSNNSRHSSRHSLTNSISPSKNQGQIAVGRKEPYTSKFSQRMIKLDDTSKNSSHASISESEDDEDGIRLKSYKPEFLDMNFKFQILTVMHLYNLEIEKNKNLRQSIEELVKIIKDLFLFCKNIFLHVKKTQKQTHQSVLESFTQTFSIIRWKLPKEMDEKFEKDVHQDENEKDQKKLKFRNKKSTINFLMQTHKNSTKLTNLNKKINPGIIIVNKIKSGELKKSTHIWPLKSVLRQITIMYDERIRMIREKRLDEDCEMPIYCFKKFINTYGFKAVAEQKFTQFLISVKNYLSMYRVNFFAKILGMHSLESENYSVDQMSKFFVAHEYIQNISKYGVAINNPESDVKYIVPYLKVIDYVKIHLEPVLKHDYLQEVRTYIEDHKEADKHYSYNGQHILDFEHMMFLILEKYKLALQQAQEFVIHAFQAADLDWNQTISLTEFVTLYRHIEANKFNFTKVLRLYNDMADIITEEHKEMTFEKFTTVCVEHQVFSETSQNQFLGVTEDAKIEELFAQLKDNFEEEKIKIQNNLDLLKEFVTSQTAENWKNILEVLETRVLSGNYSEHKIKPTLIAHKVLKMELDRLIEEGQKMAENGDNGDEDDDLDDEFFQQSEFYQRNDILFK